MRHVRLPALLALLPVLFLAGCSSYRSYRQAQIAAAQGDWDQAVLYYVKATQEDPENIAYKAALLRAKISASQQHFEKARQFQQAGVLERALLEYQQAVQLDPSNQSAQVEMGKVRDALAARQASQSGETPTLDELKKRARAASQPPVLNPRSKTPIDLDFPEPVSVMDIYRALGRAFGINILFDPNLNDQQIAIELKQVTAQDALEILMRAAGHFYKVQDEHTIIIAADTPQNRRNYEDLVIQTFFLSNAEVKDVMTMLRSLIDAKKIAVNDQLNAIVLRDTADKVKVAERIIQANDKARAEVVVDVELLQINTTKLRDLGVTYPSTLTQSLDLGGGQNDVLHLSDLQYLNQSNWTLTIPSFIYNFVKSNTDAQLLAKPQLRISEGEKASLTIGDKVPIPVTSFNTSNTVGGNIVPITSFQYQDVGIQINIEPRVHHNKEVTLKVKVEVSNVGQYVDAGNGQRQPIIGTRTIDSTIRLKDGETNFLAGLIRSDDTVTDSGLPGLSEIPIIGRLFSSNRHENMRTDVILTLTPHIIRSADITEEDLLPIWVGTESNISFRGGSPRVESDVEGPFDTGGETTPEEVQEMIRRRIERLPRGLREGEQQNGEGENPPQAPPKGIELAPGTAPSSIFDQNQPPQPPPTPPEDEQKPEEEPPPSLVRLGGGPAAQAATAVGLAAQAAVPGDAAPAAPVEETPAVRLSLTPSRLWVQPGDVFVVTVEATAAKPVAHLPLALSYDPAVLAVEDVVPGDFLGPASSAEILSDSSHPGELVLGASRLGSQPGVTGSGVVARVRFRALTLGASEIAFVRGKALGPGLQLLAPLAFETARVSVDTERRQLPPQRREPPAPPKV
jgi:general secretion pathway protein D